MNLSILGLELWVVSVGLGLLLIDLVTPPDRKRRLGLAAAAIIGVLFMMSLSGRFNPEEPLHAFGGQFVLDGLAMFFKRLFLLAGVLVLLLAMDQASTLTGGVTEFFALSLFALAGMMLCASANDFAVMFVSIELITITFYILISYQRTRVTSLEAGVKYLILGALSSAFLVYGIALVYGTSGTTNFSELAERSSELAASRLFQLGMLLVLGGLAFKIAVFPFQVWAPDVYEGSPAPTTAFLAIGSKAAGVVLLVRLVGSVVPDLVLKWEKLLMAIAALSILYGSLCAIPQRNLKRLLGYSSIAHGGYLLVGLSAMSKAGSAAILYYLAGYLFAIVAAFIIISVVIQRVGSDDISALAGLHQRSPFLAAAMTLAMVSLAGVPPLAGFLGKFLLLKAAVEQGAAFGAYYWLVAIALLGVVISLYYYLGVVRVIYWSKETPDLSRLDLSPTVRVTLAGCVAGILYLGIFPGTVWEAALAAVSGLKI